MCDNNYKKQNYITHSMSAKEEPPKKKRKISQHAEIRLEFPFLGSASSAHDVIFCIPCRCISRSASLDQAQSDKDLPIATSNTNQNQIHTEEKAKKSDKCAATTGLKKQNEDKNNMDGSKKEDDKMKSNGCQKVHVGTNSNDLKYKEYSLNSYPFIVHSKVFKTMLVDNNKHRNNSDQQVKIPLNDLDIETFEFIRDYCYGFNPKLNEKNVFRVMLASIKYMMDSMHEKCVEYIRNEWIVDYKSLFSFLTQLSAFENDTNSNIINKQSILKIFNNNKILQHYACEFAQGDSFPTELQDVNDDILILLLQCDSFYLCESSVWNMVVFVCTMHFDNSDYDGIDIHKTKEFGQILSKFVPFIRFDIIGLQYFLTEVKPLLFHHNLMTKPELCDILLSWNDQSLYKEKLTLKRQRFLFEENYLKSIDDLKVGDTVECIRRNALCDGFLFFTIISIDKDANTVTFDHDSSIDAPDYVEIPWSDIIVAKPYTTFDCINNRFANLEEGQLVQFRNVFARNDDDDDNWINGTLSNVCKWRDGDVTIKLEDGTYSDVCVNDPRCFRVKNCAKQSCEINLNLSNVVGFNLHS